MITFFRLSPDSPALRRGEGDDSDGNIDFFGSGSLKKGVAGCKGCHFFYRDRIEKGNCERSSNILNASWGYEKVGRSDCWGGDEKNGRKL
jgi:hypothetical protein